MSWEAWGSGDDDPDWRNDAIENGWWNPDDISQAIKDMWLERERQVTEEGWSEAHDDGHTDNELALAAACYAIGNAALWPWSLSWWKPAGRRRDLVKAAALIIAEIERLDRAEKVGGK